MAKSTESRRIRNTCGNSTASRYLYGLRRKRSRQPRPHWGGAGRSSSGAGVPRVGRGPRPQRHCGVFRQRHQRHKWQGPPRLRDHAEGQPTTIIAWHQDRLWRLTRDLERVYPHPHRRAGRQRDDVSCAVGASGDRRVHVCCDASSQAGREAYGSGICAPAGYGISPLGSAGQSYPRRYRRAAQRRRFHHRGRHPAVAEQRIESAEAPASHRSTR